MNYDMTVRNANGNIVQFMYGEDGMDPTKVEKQKVRTVSPSPDQIMQNTALSLI